MAHVNRGSEAGVFFTAATCLLLVYKLCFSLLIVSLCFVAITLLEHQNKTETATTITTATKRNEEECSAFFFLLLLFVHSSIVDSCFFFLFYFDLTLPCLYTLFFFSPFLFSWCSAICFRWKKVQHRSIFAVLMKKGQRNSVKPLTGDAHASPSEAQHHPPLNSERTDAGSRPKRPARRQVTARKTSPMAAGSAPAVAAPPSLSSSATQRSKSPVFWGAKKDAPLYSGPLGESVGVVPQGSVLLETSRYRDAFGGWWLSTRCDDGSLGWVAYDANGVLAETDFADGTAAPLSALPWQRVYDTRARPVSAPAEDGAYLPDNATDWTCTFPQVDVATIAELEATHFLFQEASLFDYYWTAVHKAGEHRDWNGEYQRAVEEYRMKPQLSLSGDKKQDEDNNRTLNAARERLTRVIEEFRQEVVQAVTRVCEEAVVPLAQRHVPSLPQHPNEVFYANGILLKRCVDSAGGDLGGDELAGKLGNAIYRNSELIALEAPSHLLYVPLLARCCFGGHAFLCCSIPPYGVDNLIFANPCTSSVKGKDTHAPVVTATKATDAVATRLDSDAHTAAPPPPTLVQDLLRSLGCALRLCDGEVPWEWRVYAGRDRRLYLSHTSRLLPPVLPLARESGRDSQRPSPPSSAGERSSDEHQNTFKEVKAQLYSRLVRSRVRPEVFCSWPTGWRVNECCCDCGCTTADKTATQRRCSEAELKAAVRASSSAAVGQWIKSDGITQVAGILGFHLPLNALPMPVVACNACGNTIDANELRFVVCTNPMQCCRACVQCYTRVLMDGGGGGEPLAATCAAAVRCGAGCRKAGSFIMEPSVSVVLHAHGVNVRYLPYVLHRLPLPTRPAVEHAVQVELVARATKYILQRDLCRSTTAGEARSVCETVLSALLQPTGAASERFWRMRLGPALQAHFDGICEPFQVSVHALRAVAERVQTLVGVWLSDASLESLDALSVLSRRSPAAAAAASSSVGAQERKGGTEKPEEQSNRNMEGDITKVGSEGTRPFVEIECITPRSWAFPVPPPPHHDPAPNDGEATGRDTQVAPLRGRLEAVLLFWIGNTPENADDQQQPFYLEESMFQNAA